MKLDAYLKTSKTSEQAFAAEVAVSVFAVRKWRYGQRTPSVEKINRISEVTDGAVSFIDWLPSSTEQARAS